MAKIREDLIGSVLLPSGAVLFAGDVVPDGETVGDHVTAQDEPSEDGVPQEPAGNASREAWADYARSLSLEVAEGEKREDIRSRVEAFQELQQGSETVEG